MTKNLANNNITFGISKHLQLKSISGFENKLKMQKIFLLLNLYVISLYGVEIFQPFAAKKLNILHENVYLRFLSIFFLAFGFTQDIEATVASMIAFTILCYLFQTPEERDNLFK